MQSGKGKELGSAIAGGSNSYLGNTKMSDKDKVLFKITAVLAVVLVICVLVLYVIV
jgi:protein translocase SecG subunit